MKVKLTAQEAREARNRALAYEANMAVEGLTIHPDDRALMDQIDRDGIDHETALEMVKDHLREQGVIREAEEPKIAAE